MEKLTNLKRPIEKGYAQYYEVDYIEVISPIAKLETIHVILSMAVSLARSYFN